MENSEGYRTSDCKGCGEPMVWAETSRGKRLPLDAEPVGIGELPPAKDSRGHLLFDLVPELDRDPAGRGPLGLRERGFDRSKPVRQSRWDNRAAGVRVGCSQCEALVINGVACHETGCPNAKRRSP